MAQRVEATPNLQFSKWALKKVGKSSEFPPQSTFLGAVKFNVTSYASSFVEYLPTYRDRGTLRLSNPAADPPPGRGPRSTSNELCGGLGQNYSAVLRLGAEGFGWRQWHVPYRPLQVSHTGVCPSGHRAIQYGTTRMRMRHSTTTQQSTIQENLIKITSYDTSFFDKKDCITAMVTEKNAHDIIYGISLSVKNYAASKQNPGLISIENHLIHTIFF